MFWESGGAGARDGFSLVDPILLYTHVSRVQVQVQVTITQNKHFQTRLSGQVV